MEQELVKHPIHSSGHDFGSMISRDLIRGCRRDGNQHSFIINPKWLVSHETDTRPCDSRENNETSGLKQ
jgi:hypothetical protein